MTDPNKADILFIRRQGSDKNHERLYKNLVLYRRRRKHKAIIRRKELSNEKEIKKTSASELNKLAVAVYPTLRRLLTPGTDLPPQSCFALVYAAYMAALNNVDNTKDLLSLITTKASERRAIFVKSLAGENLHLAFQLAKEHTADELRAYLYVCPRIDKYGECGSPESVSKLALKILGAKPGETIADFGSGLGDFLQLAAERYGKNPLYGIEINPPTNEISAIRLELISNNAEIELGDMFELPENKKFDRIFSNYPLAMRLHLNRSASEYIDALRKRLFEARRGTTPDWYFNSLLLDHLTDGGKAAAIMRISGTWNSLDREMREYFVRNGFVEAVILLPAGILDFTAASMMMIVLSKGNQTVKLVDATGLGKQGRRTAVLTDADVDAVAKLLTEGGDVAITVDLKQLQDNDFVLNPLRYLKKPVEIKDGVEFGSLIKRVTRGAPLKADDLDELTSPVPTDTQFLMLANMQNGAISGDLPYLKRLDPKLEKYCIRNRNLLLSKNGSPFKVAVAEIEEGRKLLGNGNLLIIELDESKVNPYFMLAFFDSEMGIAALKSIAVGSVIQHVSLESLRKLTVPLPSLKEQKEIAVRYQAKVDEIKMLQLRLQKAQNELKSVFGEVE